MIQEKKVEIKKEQWIGSTFFREYWITMIDDDHDRFKTEFIHKFENAIRTPSKFKFRSFSLNDSSLAARDTQLKIIMDVDVIYYNNFWHRLSIERRNYLYRIQ